MALFHVLELVDPTPPADYRVVIHIPVPAGTNTVGVSWKQVFLAAGRSGRTVLPDGTGPGQIMPAEKAQVTQGDVLEFDTVMDAEPLSRLPGDAQTVAQEFVQRLQDAYRLFGHSG